MISTIFYTVTVSYDSGPRVWLFASEKDAVAHIAMMFPETWDLASNEARDRRHQRQPHTVHHGGPQDLTTYFFHAYFEPEAAKHGQKVNLQHHEMWFNISHRKDKPR